MSSRHRRGRLATIRRRIRRVDESVYTFCGAVGGGLAGGFLAIVLIYAVVELML